MTIYMLQTLDRIRENDWQTVRIYNNDGIEMAKMDFEMLKENHGVDCCLVCMTIGKNGFANFQDRQILESTIED